MKGRDIEISTHKLHVLFHSMLNFLFLLVFMSISKELKDSEEKTNSCN